MQTRGLKIRGVDEMVDKNILITGISGFVGSHLAQYLKNESDNNIVGIVRDQMPSMWLDKALDNVTLIHGDIRSHGLLKRIINHYNIDQVYHLAAAAQVKEAWKDPINVFQANVIGTVNLLEACRQINKDTKVLIFNTDKVYGEKLDAIEEDPYESSEPYATSKCCQGFVAQSYIKTYDMPIKISHCCNIYGYDPLNSRLISNVVKDCIRGNNPVIYINDKSIREYIYIDDVLNAITRIMNDVIGEDERKSYTYNIRTGYIYNQEQVILKILEYFPELEAEYKEGNIARQIQKETMKSVCWHWKPSISFDDGIKETIEKFELFEDDWNRR